MTRNCTWTFHALDSFPCSFEALDDGEDMEGEF